MDYRIKEGDRVDIEFENLGEIINAKVLYTPVATDDCWRVEDEHGGIIYIQRFSTMRKRGT